MRRALLPIALAALSLATAGRLPAQNARSLGVSRQLFDSLPLTVRVDFTAGRLHIGPAKPGRMYEMDARYTPTGASVTHAWSGDASRTLRLGLDQASFDLSDDGEERRTSELRLGLTGAAPMDLSVDVGAADAELDLGGLRLSRLGLESGASQMRVHFDTPNPQPMSMLEVNAGAADIELRGLANANASEMSVSTGVGSLTLAFDGEWRRDMLVRLDMKFGMVRLRVPRDVGVRLEPHGPFTWLKQDGMVERANGWETPEWSKSTRKLVVRAETWMGRVTVERQ